MFFSVITKNLRRGRKDGGDTPMQTVYVYYSVMMMTMMNCF